MKKNKNTKRDPVDNKKQDPDLQEKEKLQQEAIRLQQEAIKLRQLKDDELNKISDLSNNEGHSLPTLKFVLEEMYTKRGRRVPPDIACVYKILARLLK